MNFSFLTSVRFWQVVVAVVAQTLATYFPDLKPIADAVTLICGVSVTIGTVDKTVEKFSK